MDSGLVKASTAAQAVGLNKFFLYRLAAEHKIPSYRAGKAVRFNVSEILAWMRTQAGADGNGAP